MTQKQQEILVGRMQDNLQILRLKLKLTQEELAKLIGSSRFTIISLESKNRKMTWNTFLSLVLVFSKNPQTDDMLTIFEIYTDELNETLKLRNR